MCVRRITVVEYVMASGRGLRRWSVCKEENVVEYVKASGRGAGRCSVCKKEK